MASRARSTPILAIALATGAARLGCQPQAGPELEPPTPTPSLLDDPLGPAPERLADVGLYLDFPRLANLHPRALEFVPQYPLYSNGLEKTRYLVLPAGAQIDSGKRDEWQFPVGTIFFKTFSDRDGTRPIETRLIRRVSDTGTRTAQWEFLVYEWDDEAQSAVRLKSTNPTERRVQVGGAEVSHEIPSRVHCRQCHLANFTPVIGFDELRLNWAPPGQSRSQLERLIERQLLTVPPAPPFAAIVDADPERRWLRGYMHGNCGHCHNGGKTSENITRLYDLRERAFVASTIGKPTEGRTKSGIRIVPGKPEESIVYLAFSRQLNEPELNWMPPLGVQVGDLAATERLAAWIRSLPAARQ